MPLKKIYNIARKWFGTSYPYHLNTIYRLSGILFLPISFKDDKDNIKVKDFDFYLFEYVLNLYFVSIITIIRNNN